MESRRTKVFKKITIGERTFDNIYQQLPPQVVRYILGFHEFDISVIERKKESFYEKLTGDDSSEEEDGEGEEAGEGEGNNKEVVIDVVKEDYIPGIYKEKSQRDQIDSPFLNKNELIRILFGYFKFDRFRHIFLLFPRLQIIPHHSVSPFMPNGFRYLDIVDEHMECKTNFKDFFRLEILYILSVKFCNFEIPFPRTLEKLGFGIKPDTFDERIFSLFPNTLKELNFGSRMDKFEYDFASSFPQLVELSLTDFKEYNFKREHIPKSLKIFKIIGRFTHRLGQAETMEAKPLINFDIGVCCEQLEEVIFRNCRVKTLFIRSLQNLTKMKCIVLQDCHIDKKALEMLPDRLIMLRIHNIEFFSDDYHKLTEIKIPKKLEILDLYFYRDYLNEEIYNAFTSSSYPDSLKILHMKEFEFDDGGGDDDNNPLLDFGHKVFDVISKDKLECFYCDMYHYPIEQICNECTSLHELSFGSNSFISRDMSKLKPEEFKLLMETKLDRIRDLSVRDYSITEYGIPRNLVYLDIHFIKIRDEELLTLPSTLRKVIFFSNRFILKKPFLELISHLKDLEILHFECIDKEFRDKYHLNEKFFAEKRPELYVHISNFYG